MAPLPDYVSGTITLTNGDTAFTGSGTGWLAAGFREGDTILGIEDNEGVVYVVETVTDNDAGTLTQPWQGATGTYTYRMRYLSDGQRVTAQARQLIEMLGNGNLQALAGLDGTPNTLAMFTGTGAMVEVPRTDLVSGANYDVQVDTLAERAAYDGSDAGFAVLVSDVGDGRAAIYSKLSGTSGDWSAPAYVTGPFTDVTVGTVTELDYGDTPTITGTSGPGTLELDFGLPGGPALSVGSVTRGDADVTSTPVTGGFELDFTIPSQVAQGDYTGATAYVTGDIVQDQGSSWVALQPTTGNAPPTLPTTSNAYWQLLARAGNDGAGTVTTLVAGDGIDIDSTDPTMPVVSGVLFGTGTQGDVPGPTAGDVTAGRVLAADGTWVDAGGVASDSISAIEAMSLAEYNALPSPDPNTLYFLSIPSITYQSAIIADETPANTWTFSDIQVGAAAPEGKLIVITVLSVQGGTNTWSDITASFDGSPMTSVSQASNINRAVAIFSIEATTVTQGDFVINSPGSTTRLGAAIKIYVLDGVVATAFDSGEDVSQASLPPSIKSVNVDVPESGIVVAGITAIGEPNGGGGAVIPEISTWYGVNQDGTYDWVSAATTISFTASAQGKPALALEQIGALANFNDGATSQSGLAVAVFGASSP